MIVDQNKDMSIHLYTWLHGLFSYRVEKGSSLLLFVYIPTSNFLKVVISEYKPQDCEL